MTQTVTVLMPTYNRASMIREAIGSILAQSHADLQLLIWDDGSTDDTESVVAGVSDPRLQYLRSAENEGVATANNHLLALVNTRYAAFLGSDDSCHPARLARQLSAIGHTGAAAILTGMVWCTNQIPPKQPPLIAMDCEPTVRHLHWTEDYDRVANGSALFDMEAITGRAPHEILLFDRRLSLGGSDRSWLLQLNDRAGGIWYIPEPLYYIRQHSQRLTNWRRDRSLNPAWFDRMAAIAAGAE